MGYCDFASVSDIIMKQLNEGSNRTRSALFRALFQTFWENDVSRDFSYDNGQLSRWFNGQVRLPDVLLDFYQKKHAIKWLIQDMQYCVLPSLSDSSLAVQQLHGLVINDESISLRKRKKLCRGYPFDSDSKEGEFIAEILFFGMTRPFIKREKAELVKCVSGHAVLKDYILDGGVPKPCRAFCGRTEELGELHDHMLSAKKVFLRGIAGIGKSEVAKAYAERYRDCYKDVLYLQYNGDLRADIARMNFQEDTAENATTRFQRHEAFIRGLSSESLLIIDNYNAAPGDDELIEKILKYRCRVLITTRCVYSEYDEYELKEIKGKQKLLELFSKYYTQTEKEKYTIWEIIQTVHAHTFVLELAARLLELDAISPRRLLKKLEKEKAAMDAADYIGVSKDGHRINETYGCHIRFLFGLYHLSLSHQFILRNLCICPATGIKSSLFSYALKLPDLNHVTKLVDMGLIRREGGGVISLQPIIREAAAAELKPSIMKCRKLVDSLTLLCCMHTTELENSGDISNVLESVICEAENDNDERYIRFLNDALVHMSRYHVAAGVQLIREKMGQLVQAGRLNNNQMALCLQDMALQSNNLDEKITLQLEAIEKAKPVNQANACLVSNLYANLAGIYRAHEELDRAMEAVCYALKLYDQFNVQKTADYLTQAALYASMLIQSRRLEEAEKILDELDALLVRIEDTKSDHAMEALKLRAYLERKRGNVEKSNAYLMEFNHRCKEIYHGDMSRIIEKMII